MGDAEKITETLNGQFAEVFGKSLEWGDFEKAGTDDEGIQGRQDFAEGLRTAEADSIKTERGAA